jgi:hypothetical protein
VEIHHPKTMTTPVKFQLRRDTATNWSTNNPILLLGEPGFDSTNNQLRIGDGVTGWNSLNQVDVKGNGGVALGYAAGYTGQGLRAVSVGYHAGQYGQGTQSIAIGANAGQTGQGSNSIAIGSNAGQTGQAPNALAIGNSAGFSGQNSNSIAIGTNAGNISQSINSVAIGLNAGLSEQRTSAVAIGTSSGSIRQQANSIAIGIDAGFIDQQTIAISIGDSAGRSNQQSYGIAIGSQAGYTGQQSNAISIGQSSGRTDQQSNSIAIGQSSGLLSQQTNAIAIGVGAGGANQSSSAIAIGPNAGFTGQGMNSIAIGSNAGYTGQANNSIILNATGNRLSGVPGQTGSFYVSPVRSDNTQTLGLAYNSSTNEIITSTGLISSGPTGPTGPGNGVASLNPYASFVTYSGAGGYQAIYPINYNVSPNFPSRADINTIKNWTQTPVDAINSAKSLYCGGSVVTIIGITGPAGEYFIDAGFVPTVTGLYQISANFFVRDDGPAPISFGHCNPQVGNIQNVWVSLDRVSATVLSANTAAGGFISASMSFSDILTAGTKYCFVGGGYGATSGGAGAQGGNADVSDNSQVTFSLLSTNATAIDGTSP